MIKDIDFIREILINIEENYKPLEFYDICSSMTRKGYSRENVYYELELMEKAGFFHQVAKNMSYGFEVMGLSYYGMDFLEKIKNDTVWEKTKKEIKNKNLPRTFEFIAQIAGIFCGELIKHSKKD